MKEAPARPATPEELLARRRPNTRLRQEYQANAPLRDWEYNNPVWRREYRRELWEKDPRCHYCGRVTLWTDDDPLRATLEHLLDRGDPRRTDTFNPIVLACHECNNRFGSPAGKALKKLRAGDPITDHERKTILESYRREVRRSHHTGVSRPNRFLEFLSREQLEGWTTEQARRAKYAAAKALSPEHLEALRARKARRAAKKESLKYRQTLPNQVWDQAAQHFTPQLHAWDWD